MMFLSVDEGAHTMHTHEGDVCDTFPESSRNDKKSEIQQFLICCNDHACSFNLFDNIFWKVLYKFRLESLLLTFLLKINLHVSTNNM